MKNEFYGWQFHKLKEAIRFLRNHKGSTVIHIIGFSFGITICLLLFIFYTHENSFDEFHKDHESVYRIITQTNPSEYLGVTPWPTGPYMKNDFPDLITTRVYHTFRKTPTLSTPDGLKIFYEDDLFFVDSTFFDVLTFDLLIGDKKSVLTEPNSLVITESLARKFFGSEDPMGKELLFESKLRMTVTGIVEDPPGNSHFVYQAFAPLINIDQLFAATGNSFPFDGWYWTSVNTYVRLPHNMDAALLENDLQAFTKKHIPQEYAHRRTFLLQPLADIHLYSGHIQDVFVEKRTSTEVAATLVIAIMVLIIALVNFINLTTSTSIERIKSISIHRILGSSLLQINFQLLLETILICLFSFITAITLTWLLLPYFNDFVNARIPLSDYFNFGYFWLYFLGIVLLGFLVGIYPSYYTVSLARKHTVRGNTMALNASGKPWLRRILVTFQFFTTIILIYGAIVFYGQFDFLLNKELGFSKENVLMIPVKGTEAARQLERFTNGLEQSPYVIHTSVMSDILGEVTSLVPYHIDGSEEQSNIPTFFVGFDFVKTYGLKVIEGRDFNKTIFSDSSAYLVNKSALKYFQNGWENAHLGKGKGNIIGVIEDFHFEDLHKKIEPLIIGINDNWLNFVTVRIAPGNKTAIINDLESRWKKIETQKPFHFIFLDDKIQALYENEKDQTYLMGLFSFFGIMIASLGLLGLVTFTIKLKLKEIGIRKVLGANFRQIYYVITKDFGLLFLMASILALPVAYYLMSTWLNNYPVRIELHWSYYVGAGGIVAILTWLTISYRSIKATYTNPVDVIRTE